jgi:hypothetical protein
MEGTMVLLEGKAGRARAKYSDAQNLGLVTFLTMASIHRVGRQTTAVETI